MSLISVTDLTFAHDGSYENVFEHVSFQLDTRWKLGFTGRNGRGKTTFLQLLQGKWEYCGSIAADVQLDYFPFAIADPGRFTWEVLEEICPTAEAWELGRELSLLEMEEGVLYRPFEKLSSGEQTKVLLAALFLRENNFLLIDEPTNHLDMHAREVLARYLQRQKQGFILVSHDRAFLDGCIDHVLSINRANIEVQQGTLSSYLLNKERQDHFELAENARLQREIRRLETAAQQTARWSDKVEKTKNQRNSGLRPDKGYIGHKAAKMMQRSISTRVRQERAIEEKRGLLKNIEQAETLKIHPLQYHSRVLIRAQDLGIALGERTLFEGLSFTVEQGERTALLGRNGAGKSTLLRLLEGEELPHTGQLTVASGLVISHLAQETDHLYGDLRTYAEREEIDESLFKTILRKLDFSRTQLEKPIETYSGGQKKKVLLARSLCERAHLYIWDEPLNFIDLLSRMQIEELLRENEATMLFVEHDRTFVERVATKYILLDELYRDLC